jgi:hypothetical protein
MKDSPDALPGFDLTAEQKRALANARIISQLIGDVLAEWMIRPDNAARGPTLVVGEAMAGLMAAAASFQSCTEDTPEEAALRFQIGVSLAKMFSPAYYLGEKFKSAVASLSGDDSVQKLNVPPAPGVN